MDVVVSPTGPADASWSLKDRLGRTLGTIERSDHPTGFEIKPEAGNVLNSISRLHATLDEAMTAIAKHLRGECSLDSQEWG